MYLALFQDLIAVGQYDNARYSYGNDDLRQTSTNFDLAPQKRATAHVHRSGFLDPQQLGDPIAQIPSICVTPPDSKKPEPLIYTICEDAKYGHGGNGSRPISDGPHEEVDQPNSSGCNTGRKEGSVPVSTLGTSTMEDIEELSCSPYQHDVESLTQDYEDWLRLAQGAMKEACGDYLADSAGGRISPSMATSQELILWRPEPTTTSRKASTRRFNVRRRFSLNQPMVYPFRNKRNSV